MHSLKYTALILLICLFSFIALSCKKSDDSGQGQQTAPSPKVTANWVEAYRTPASQQAGAYLAMFSYNSISAPNQNAIFVAADYPNPEDKNNRMALVLRSTDGGSNWKELPVKTPGATIVSMNSVSFYNPSLGWAVGLDPKGQGYLLSTTDGGETWASMKIEYKQTPTCVKFTGPQTGFIVGTSPMTGDEESEGGPSDILGTTDGGKTWGSLYHLPASINDITFTDAQHGWVAGVPAAIYYTTDGGRTWDSGKTGLESAQGPADAKGKPQKPYSFTSISFVDANYGWAVAQGEAQSLVLKTTDGGKTWVPLWVNQQEKLRAVYFQTQSKGWVATEEGNYVYRTDDEGRSWQSEPMKFEQKEPLYRFTLSDPAHAWAVGGGAIFRRVSN